MIVRLLTTGAHIGAPDRWRLFSMELTTPLADEEDLQQQEPGEVTAIALVAGPFAGVRR